MDNLVTASISFVAAVVAVVVGQLLGQRVQRSADERGWEREDAARRRVRGEDLAREVRKALLAAAAEFSNEAGRKRAGGRRGGWELPSRNEVRRHTERARDLSIEIPELAVRDFVELASRSLEGADDANQMGAPEPWNIGRIVVSEVDALFGAYVRGDDLPPTTEVRKIAGAVDDYWAEMEEFRRERQEERAEARAADAPSPTA